MDDVKTVMVTGMAGFIGSNVFNYWLKKYPEIRFIGIDKISYCSDLRNVQLDRDNSTFIKVDLTDAISLSDVFDTYSIDAVVHFAAYTHVDHSFKNSLEFTKNNVLGTHHLLELARKHEVKKFIHVSTDEVYGSSESISTEETQHDPTNPYAATKSASEQLARSYYHSFNLPLIITRGNNVYGPHQYPDKLIPIFALRLLRGQKCYIQGSGDQKRSFLYVDDVVRAFDLILMKGVIGKIYNIGSEAEKSVNEVASDILGVLKPEGKVEDWFDTIKDRDFNDARYNISSQQLEDLGWKMEVPFNDGLIKTIAWYREHQDRWSSDNIMFDAKIHEESVVIGLMSCCSLPKYRNQMDACQGTWVRMCQEKNVPVYFYTGENCGDLGCKSEDSSIVHLKGVGNDFHSSTFKQWYGLKHMYETHPKARFYHLAGTDTFVQIKPILSWLSTYNPDDLLYLGGHGDNRKMIDDDGETDLYYHSGGSGFVISNAVMAKIYPHIDHFIEDWNRITSLPSTNYLYDACDVAIAYLLRRIGNVETITTPHFRSCDWKGCAHNGAVKCCGNSENKLSELWVCHYMEPHSMGEMYVRLISSDRRLDFLSQFNKVVDTPSDISQHLTTLYIFSRECKDIVECGVRTPTSTWSFMQGLIHNENENETKRLTSIDIQPAPEESLQSVKEKASEHGIKFSFIQKSDLEVDLSKEGLDPDLIFIDTWHVYGQLKRELKHLSPFAKKYIILHDTTVDGIYGETIRNGWNAEEQSEESGIPVEEITKGLWPAVMEFLADNDEWELYARFTHNNGLTILKKK